MTYRRFFNSGWAPITGKYYATASRRLSQPIMAFKTPHFFECEMECVVEYGESLGEAEEKLKQRMEHLCWNP